MGTSTPIITEGVDKMCRVKDLPERYKIDEDKKETIINSFLDLNDEEVQEEYNFKRVDWVGNCVLYINTKLGEWYIELREEDTFPLVLFHKNSRYVQKQYHKEKRFFDGVTDVLQYVSDHDTAFETGKGIRASALQFSL